MKEIEKNNEIRIKDLKEKKKSLEQASQDLYGITEIVDVKEVLREKEKKREI